MTTSKYPYAKLNEDGYELEVVEQTESATHPFLRQPIPTEEARFAARPGDLVKLIFRYRDFVQRNGQTLTGEHMWVRVVELRDGFLVGVLDNDPAATNILKADQEIHFHPKHIVKFWSDEQTPAF